MKFTGERFIPEALKETDDTYQEHVERYTFACAWVDGLKVLDASCGAGYGSNMLAKTAADVHGIDIDPETIEYARKTFGAPNIHFEVMDIRRIGYPDSFFDVVVSFETIEHIDFQQAFLKEIHRVLKPNGVLILSTPNAETAPKDTGRHSKFHVKELSLTELRGCLSGFRGIEIYSQKMSYHKRFFKKIRLFARYPKNNLRERFVNFCRKRYANVEAIPLWLRIFYYEYALKFKVFSSRENNPWIKPTFWIIKATADK